MSHWHGTAHFHYLLDPSHKSHNASDKYPTIHHLLQKCGHACTFLLQSNVLGDMGLVHGWIYATVLFLQNTQNRNPIACLWEKHDFKTHFHDKKLGNDISENALRYYHGDLIHNNPTSDLLMAWCHVVSLTDSLLKIFDAIWCHQAIVT